MRHPLRHVTGRIAGVVVYRPACECGWQARLPRLTPWAAARAHALHVLAAAGGQLETLYLPEPERYIVEWEVRVDESWIPARQTFADGECAFRYSWLLDNLPAAVRHVRFTDQGADYAA